MSDSNTLAMGSDIQGSFDQLRSEMRRHHEGVRAAIHSRESKLLRALYSFAESNEQRLAHAEATTSAMIVRLATLETRLLEVEKRLNMPPAA
jgi:hypothetical protein